MSAAVVSLESGAVFCSAQCGACNGEPTVAPLAPTTCLDTRRTLPASRYRLARADHAEDRHVDRCRDRAAFRATSHVHSCTSGGALGHLCRLYAYPVFLAGVSYRNLFCALCALHQPPFRHRECFSYLRTGPGVAWRRARYEQQGFGMVLTSLQPLYRDVQVRDADAVGGCGESQWYDYVRVSTISYLSL